jgi:hypothetical protein
MSSTIIDDRNFPLRLIAGLNERAREDSLGETRRACP